MKKIICFILSVIFLANLFPVQVMAQEQNSKIEAADSSNNYKSSFYYEKDGMLFSIHPRENYAHLNGLTENYSKSVEKLIIPEKVLGYPITQISNISAKKLKEVVIPKTVKTICAETFLNDKMISVIKINGQLEYIGEGAFTSTAFFKNKNNWENDCLYINNCLIRCRKNKGKLKVKAGTVTIAEKAVNGKYEDEYKKYSSISAVEIPNSVKFINYGALYGCRDLKNIKIGNGVRKIDELAFNNTTYSNNKKNWKNGLLYVGNYLVDSKSQKKYTIRNGTKLIAKGVFRGRGKTKSVNIPDSVKYINDEAFAFCKNIKIIKLPKNLINISDNALPADNEQKYKLESISIDKSNKYYATSKGVLYNKSITKLIAYPNGNKRASYTLPKTVKQLDCNKLSPYIQQIKFNEGIQAVYHMEQLINVKSVYLPKSVEFAEFCGNGTIKTIYGHAGSYAEKEFKNSTTKKFVPVCEEKHRFNTVKEKPATCFEKGRTEYKVCEKCGYTVNYIITAKRVPNAPKVTAKKKKNTITWKKVKSAKGYELQYIFKGKTKVMKTKSAKLVIKKAKKGNYKIRIRAYTTKNGNTVYSPWSKTKSVKLK